MYQADKRAVCFVLFWCFRTIVCNMSGGKNFDHHNDGQKALNIKINMFCKRVLLVESIFEAISLKEML